MDWKKLATFVAAEINSLYMVAPHSIMRSLELKDPNLYNDFKAEIGAEFAGEYNNIVSLIARKYKCHIRHIATLNNTSISTQSDQTNAENFGKAF